MVAFLFSTHSMLLALDQQKALTVVSGAVKDAFVTLIIVIH